MRQLALGTAGLPPAKGTSPEWASQGCIHGDLIATVCDDRCATLVLIRAPWDLHPRGRLIDEPVSCKSTAYSPMSGSKFERLLATMARLRAPNGCPWDREQTFDTLRPYLIEETYEVLDAIERGDWPHLAEELGDLQLQIVFQAQIASEQGLFTIDEVLDHIHEKLVRRHPHVFGDESLGTAGEVIDRWEQIKTEEKKRAGGLAKQPPAKGGGSLLDKVPRAQPALLEAEQITKRVAKVGFDWQKFDDLLAKLHEELEELAQARAGNDRGQIEDEVGDLLFMIVNIARYLGIHPELALRRTNQKFRRRFAHIEEQLRRRGKQPETSNIEEMEEIWQQSKNRNTSSEEERSDPAAK